MKKYDYCRDKQAKGNTIIIYFIIIIIILYKYHINNITQHSPMQIGLTLNKNTRK